MTTEQAEKLIEVLQSIHATLEQLMYEIKQK